MASGSNRAQELLGDTKCDLCDTYKNVSWKCQNCNDILCEQCKRSHLRSRVSKNHIVIELEDSRDDNQGSSIFCPDHEEDAFQMFCTTCDTLVCLNCISGKHKGHEFKMIKEVAISAQNNLEGKFKQIKTQIIPNLEQSLISITNLQENYSQDIDRAVTDIRTKGDELMQEITNIQDRLIDEVMQQATLDKNYLSDKTDRIDLRLKTLKEQLRDHEEKMKTFTDIDIIAKATSIKTSMSQRSESPDMPELKPPKFQTGNINKGSLENMFGKIIFPQKPRESQTETSKSSSKQIYQPCENVEQEKSKYQDTSVIKGNVFSSYKWRNYLKTIQITNQNEAWMLTYGPSNNDQYLELVNDQGKRITSIKHDFYIRDIALTNYGDLLLTEETIIRRASKTGIIETFADLSPYKTHGIHVTQNDDILVGLIDRRMFIGRVIRLSSTGRTKQVIDSLKKDVNMGIPNRVTENVNCDIVMICDLYGSNVIVADKDGRYRFSYCGPPSTIKMTTGFNPTDIICNQIGQILVADGNNSTIHLLDKDGAFIKFILTKQHGIEDPKALAKDRSGKIWVGCKKGKVFIAKLVTS